MKLVCCFVLLISALTFCTKKSEKCGKITDVTIFPRADKKDTITVKFKVMMSATDLRSFAEYKNAKKHPDQFWYDLIGTQYCVGDHLPD